MNQLATAPNPLEAKAQVRELTKKRDRLLAEIEDLNTLKKKQGEDIGQQLGQKKSELERLTGLVATKAKQLRTLNEVIDQKIALVDDYAEKTTNTAIKQAVGRLAYARGAENEALDRVVQISRLDKTLRELEESLKVRQEALTAQEAVSAKRSRELDEKERDLEVKANQLTADSKKVAEREQVQIDAESEASALITAAQTKAEEILSAALTKQKELESLSTTLETQRTAQMQKEKLLEEEAEKIRKDRLYLEDQQATFQRAKRRKGR